MHSDCFSRLSLPETIHIRRPYELACAVESIDSSPINYAIIEQKTHKDPKLCELIKCIKYGLPLSSNSDIKMFSNVFNQLYLMKGGILYNNRVFFPDTLRSRVHPQFHI